VQGLLFIHEAGVIHLDLKPANIFVTGEGRFKIGDFGMASIWPRGGHVDVGTFEREGDKLYLAPEVLQGKYGKAADVFRQVPIRLYLFWNNSHVCYFL
jgi:mitosis inhibitor protein kinase SWE1